jgi:DNA-directed RNA polymerase specialized sigma24 family protein
MTEKEKTLIAGCVKGDKAVWDAFVLQYSKLAYSTIRSTLTLHHALPQDDIVEDLHQNFFLSICENDFRKLRQFKGDRGCSLASWLRVIASRLTVEFLRKQESSSVEASNEYEDIHDPSDTSAVESKALRRAVEGLPSCGQFFVNLRW